jgi:hypothetical protein
MRAQLVEFMAEVVELALLGAQAGSGRDGGILLEGEMHAFVDGVLLGAAGLDELGVDAELDEPDGEGGEASEGGGGERDAVVGADAMGKAELLEEPGEVLLGLVEGDFGVGVDAQDEPGGEVGDSEGEAIGAISEAELTFVVSGPNVVGLLRGGLGAAGVSPTIAAPRADEAMAGKDPGDSGDGREVAPGVTLAEEVEEDAWAPGGVSQAKVDDLLGDGGISLRG